MAPAKVFVRMTQLLEGVLGWAVVGIPVAFTGLLYGKPLQYYELGLMFSSLSSIVGALGVLPAYLTDVAQVIFMLIAESIFVSFLCSWRGSPNVLRSCMTS